MALSLMFYKVLEKSEVITRNKRGEERREMETVFALSRLYMLSNECLNLRNITCQARGFSKSDLVMTL